MTKKIITDEDIAVFKDQAVKVFIDEDGVITIRGEYAFSIEAHASNTIKVKNRE